MAEDMAGQMADETGGSGDARVDQAMSSLGDLADVPLEQHPAIFERIHDRLRAVLGELNPGQPGIPGPARPPGPPGSAGAP
jgi:hypothetical protein